jgi:hypothetical protein
MDHLVQPTRHFHEIPVVQMAQPLRENPFALFHRPAQSDRDLQLLLFYQLDQSIPWFLVGQLVP